MTVQHICNTTNKYYRYCKKNGISLIGLPKGHCIWCGDDLKE